MSKSKEKSPFEVAPGFIILKPYVDKDSTFLSTKESPGYSQLSEVVAIGEDYVDDNGNQRGVDIEVGDIILHEYAPNECDIKFDKYRAIRFYNVIAKLNI